ncbi:hypothetical protein CC2G_009612 [Coprinopsis cinerea AmutBmut pab1-1]|nr:hypothetical protein CC2G_009612 [Coprinopsis cinerea AmutBmut pab1-1]
MHSVKNKRGRSDLWCCSELSLVLRESASASADSTFTILFPSNQCVLSNLPQLRRVAIEHSRSADLWAPALFDLDTDADRQGLPLPWKQLTHLSIVPWITYETWPQIFKSCTSLVRGTFFIVDSGETDDTGTRLIPLLPHPNLIDLTLIHKHFTDEPFVFEFDVYNFPSLTSLRLGAYNQPHTTKAFDWSRIRAQIFNLTTLSLYHLTWEMEVSEIVQLFLATPNLLSLAMGVSTDYNAVFEHFQIDWNGHALLPKLKELTLDCVDARYKDLEDDTLAGTTTSRSESSRFLSLTADGFSEMVKDRWRPVEEIAQIERVSLFLPRTHEPMLEAVRHSLRREVKEGLHLTVQVSERPLWDDPHLGDLVHWDEK